MLADADRRTTRPCARGRSGSPTGIGEVVESTAKVGGGALPLLELPGPVVAVDGAAEELAARLRTADPPVVGRIQDGRLLLDPRTLADDEIDLVPRGARLTRGPAVRSDRAVPKYDAFGREIGEDTLEGLGGSPEQPDSAWEQRTEREEADWEQAEQVEVARLQAQAAAEDAQAERAEDARQAAAASGWTAPAEADEAQRRELAAQLSGALQQATVSPVDLRPDRHRPPLRQRQGLPRRLVVVLVIGGVAIGGIVSLVGTVDRTPPTASRP